MGGAGQKFPGVEPREPHTEHPDGSKVSRFVDVCLPSSSSSHRFADGKLAVHTRGTQRQQKGMRGGTSERASYLTDSTFLTSYSYRQESGARWISRLESEEFEGLRNDDDDADHHHAILRYREFYLPKERDSKGWEARYDAVKTCNWICFLLTMRDALFAVKRSFLVYLSYYCWIEGLSNFYWVDSISHIFVLNYFPRLIIRNWIFV